MHRPLTLLVLSAFALACSPPAADETIDTGDTDTDGDTDAGVDTEEDPDADTDTDTDVPSNVVRIRQLRLNSGAFAEGEVYTIEDVVVVAVSNVAGRRGFLVQDPDPTERAFAGLFVGADSPVLPVAGDLVTVSGVYSEDELGAVGAPAPAATLTRLDVSAADPSTTWTPSGTATLPVPIPVTVSDFASAAAESYESMRIRLVERDAQRLEVFSSFDAQGTFLVSRVASAGSRARVSSVLRTLADDFDDLSRGDTFAAIGGTVWWSAEGHVLAPTSLADLEDYEVVAVDTDTDTLVDTDTDTLVDTDTDTLVDTDTDTDTYIPETGVDTFVFADTDTGADTDISFIDATIPDLRAGIYTPGDVLAMSNVVVTSVRLRTSPVSTNSFTVQVPGGTENSGLYVFIGSNASLPAIGDLVDVTGIYQEIPEGIADRFATLSRLQSGPVYLNTGWTLAGSGTAPTPRVITVPTLAPAATAKLTAEPLESMLVTVTDPAGFQVVSNPIASPSSIAFGDFRVKVASATAPTELWISSHFFNTDDVYDVDVGDRFTSVTGIVYWDGNHYKVAPRSLDDWTAYVDN